MRFLTTFLIIGIGAPLVLGALIGLVFWLRWWGLAIIWLGFAAVMAWLDS